jgi:hypothetical protein
MAGGILALSRAILLYFIGNGTGRTCLICHASALSPLAREDPIESSPHKEKSDKNDAKNDDILKHPLTPYALIAIE